jgi:hypothetical protein
MDTKPKMYGRRDWKRVNQFLGGVKMLSSPVAASTKGKPKAKAKGKPNGKVTLRCRMAK